MNPKKWFKCKGCPNQMYGNNTFCTNCIQLGRHHINKAQTIEDCRTEKLIRKMLLHIRGNRCEICGLESWLGKPIPVEVSHEDGNSSNNTAENLKLRCRNCHGIMPDHKGKGIGLKMSARNIARRKRYAEGKTW